MCLLSAMVQFQSPSNPWGGGWNGLFRATKAIRPRSCRWYLTAWFDHPRNLGEINYFLILWNNLRCAFVVLCLGGDPAERKHGFLMGNNANSLFEGESAFFPKCVHYFVWVAPSLYQTDSDCLIYHCHAALESREISTRQGVDISCPGHGWCLLVSWCLESRYPRSEWNPGTLELEKGSKKDPTQVSGSNMPLLLSFIIFCLLVYCMVCCIFQDASNSGRKKTKKKHIKTIRWINNKTFRLICGSFRIMLNCFFERHPRPSSRNIRKLCWRFRHP